MNIKWKRYDLLFLSSIIGIFSLVPWIVLTIICESYDICLGVNIFYGIAMFGYVAFTIIISLVCIMGKIPIPLDSLTSTIAIINIILICLRLINVIYETLPLDVFVGEIVLMIMTYSYVKLIHLLPN